MSSKCNTSRRRAMFFFSLSIVFLAHTMVFGQGLTIATYRYNTNTRVANLSPFALELQKALHQPVVVKSYDSVQELVQAMRAGKADIIFISTMGYLLYDNSSLGIYEPVVKLELNPASNNNYRSCMVGKATIIGDDLKSINLKDLRIGFVNPGSSSGNLVPRLAFASAGVQSVEAASKAVIYTQTHRGALDSVMNGSLDLAAFGSGEYFKWSALNPDNRQIKLIWLSNEIPLGPVMFRRSLNNTVKEQITACLKNLHIKTPVAFDAIKEGWTEAKNGTQFKEVKREDYYEFLNTDYSAESIIPIIENALQ